jgi:hypothetical protein
MQQTMRRLKGIAISLKITFQAIAGGATINQIFGMVHKWTKRTLTIWARVQFRKFFDFSLK